MNEKFFSVPLIHTDLRREELVYQLAGLLEHVDKISETVFSSITNKIGETQTKLKSINSRLDTCQAKINQIRGSRKATTIFASAKYPASETEKADYKCMLSSYPNDRDENLQINVKYKIVTKCATFTESDLKEKKEFFNVKTIPKKKNDFSQTGLGRLPENIDSISSLLLFNTCENPYRQYVSLDPLGVVTKIRKDESNGEKDQMAEAPQTIREKNDIDKKTGENYTYMPGLGNVPDIAVPDNLPDLLNIVDDITFDGNSYNINIAPSALPDLPLIDDSLNIPDGPAALNLDGASASMVFKISDQSLPPPPPPPPPPPSAPVAQPLTSQPLPIVKTEDIPTPQVPSTVDDSKKSNDVTDANEKKPVISSDRANLMEQIRNKGKNSLKKSHDRKLQKKEQKEVAAVKEANSGGDMMSELQNRLKMRRTGIAGNKTLADTLVKASENIPNVPKHISIASDESDSQDWD